MTESNQPPPNLKAEQLFGDAEIIEAYYQNEEQLTHSLRDLDQLYGSREYTRYNARTFLEYAYRKYAFGRLTADSQDQENPNWALLVDSRLPNIIGVTRALQSATEIVNDQYGIDLLKDRRTLLDKPGLYKEIEQDLIERAQEARGLRQIERDTMAYVFAKDLVNLFGGNKATYRKGIEITHESAYGAGIPPAISLAAEAQRSYYEQVVKDPSQVRYEAQRQLRRLMEPDVQTFLEFNERALADVYTEKTAHEVAIAREILDSQKQELDYTILPPGTDLEAVAHEIVDELEGQTSAPAVDLRRVAVLEEIRQLSGPDNCYLMRGKKSNRGLTDEEGMLISEDYIGLVMQHHDSDGGVVREDCLAISPIANKHAGYVVRQDASAGISWREILSLPKRDAIQYFGARRLRFDPVAAEDKYDAYVKKVVTLLTCEPEEFGPDYRLRRRGDDYEMSYRPSIIGKGALQAAALMEALEK